MDWDKDVTAVSPFRLLRMNAKEWWLLLIGFVASIGVGSAFPLIALVFSQVLDAYAGIPSEVVENVSVYAGLLVVLAFAYAFSCFVQVQLHVFYKQSLCHNRINA